MRELIVMRLADMKVRHTRQITAHCSRCDHEVGIFPSGQQVLVDMPDAAIVCIYCYQKDPAEIVIPAPREPDIC